MIIVRPMVGQVVHAVRDLALTGNIHVTRLTNGPVVLRKGSEAEITAIIGNRIELMCKDGPGVGPAAWGLRISIAIVIFGLTFE